MEAIIVAVVAAVPATVAATAAWRSSRQAAHQTNGMLHEPLARMEGTLDIITKLVLNHMDDGHNHTN